MLGATIDKSKRLPIYFRVARNGTVTFVFLNPDESPYDISDEDFALKIFFKEGGSLVYEPQQVVPSPITNEITFAFTEAGTTIRARKYYWELISQANVKTWLNGPAFAHEGEFDDKNQDEVTITVNQGDTVVKVYPVFEVEEAGHMVLIGDWQGSTNLLPSTNVKKGYAWTLVSSTTTLFGPDGGIIPAGTIIVAKVDNPGQDITKWNFIVSIL